MPTYEELFTEDAVRDIENAGLSVPAKEDMTCNGCSEVETCPFAWDLYNTQGDCEKESTDRPRLGYVLQKV